MQQEIPVHEKSYCDFIVERDQIVDADIDSKSDSYRSLKKIRKFRHNEILAEGLPADITLAWVCLPPFDSTITDAQNLHCHPVDTLMVVTQGKGLCEGDSTLELVEGDLVYIPAWNHHRFISSSSDGFYALSIAFSHRDFFEQAINTRNKFDNPASPFPSLAQRQMQCAHIEDLSSPEFIKMHDVLNPLLLEGFDISWQVVSRSETFIKPPESAVRLIVVCSGKGCIMFSDEKNIATAISADVKTGDAFWQCGDVFVERTSPSELNILILEVPKNKS